MKMEPRDFAAMRIIGAWLLILLMLLISTFACSSQEVHKYSTDPPTEWGNYLTFVNIKITISEARLKNQGDTMLIQVQKVVDSTEIVRWEVLQFNPDLKSLPKWNTLHLDNGEEDVKVTVLYWTELPHDPFGSSFEATSGAIRPPK